MARVIVYHGYYGCETGCCGHWAEIGPDDEDTEDLSVYGFDEPIRRSRFAFMHPHSNDDIEWAKQMIVDEFGDEHVKDLDWENCRVVDD